MKKGSIVIVKTNWGSYTGELSDDLVSNDTYINFKWAVGSDGIYSSYFSIEIARVEGIFNISGSNALTGVAHIDELVKPL